MQCKVALLHFAAPPGIGGVETTLAHQARILSELGYSVRVVAGQGASFNPNVEMVIHPLLGSQDPRIRALKHALDQGDIPSSFEAIVDEIGIVLRSALDLCEVCIVHNVHTLHKNLALTTALNRLSAPHLIAFCHDLAWTNLQYSAELHEGYPWNLLMQAWANTRYVTVSHARREELAELLALDSASIPVIPPGLDLAQFFQWSETTRFLSDSLRLPDADTVLLLPARLTRRKNIALALKIMRALIDLDGKDHRLVVTGPPGPHNPLNASYLDELLSLRHALDLDQHVHFLYRLREPPLIPDDATLASLYQLADGLLFPSSQEGFGIPILEAGIAGLPVFCADLPPLRETAQGDAIYFHPDHDSPEKIAALIHHFFQHNAQHRLKVRTRHHYQWDVIVRQQLVPLLEENR